ncbi:2-phospho-L-lactate transferase [Croceicoccus estronivorus]|uniref:2-phospho-L-lactate transferase n=1 Tax=Croceicoccus estronivorus TaxID=1172626 RepID=UPI00082C804C|nr:2-phospho-L-lactate transferase [Croceicoccus estronivorus]OCC25534.1 2-phospho-L-lactate transferase [Croceicoccus estronivorus]
MKPRVLALCGGIGGAKLALGLSHILPPSELAILVNTGDDFEHLGLSVSPDVDTVTYTLAGLNNTELGWGLASETWAFMDQLKKLGGEDWFNLGDRDLALHVERTRRLHAGESLTAITADLTPRLGVAPAIWPMSDDPVRTVLETDEGILAFQRYFVGRRAEPAVQSIAYEGSDTAQPNPLALEALNDPALEAVVICPSNPWLSVAPLLAMPALRAALAGTSAPVIAVSPIVGGRAIKGPTAKLMGELGLPVTAASVAQFYAGLIDGYVLDEADRDLADAIAGQGPAVDIVPTVMTDLASRQTLARDVLAFAGRLRNATA